MTKQDLQKIIQEEIHNYQIEEGITSWMVNKVANGFKWYIDKKAHYQYDALLNDKSFRSLASSYGYKSEEEWIKKAKELINKDPQRFRDILAYDVRKGSFGHYFK